MPNEVKESSRAPLQDVLLHVLDMMKHMVSGPDGKIPDSYIGAFDEVFNDTAGNPMIQTLGGMIVTVPEALENGHLHYSPNLGVDVEGLCIEAVNIAKYVASQGYELVVCNCHYIDGEGQVVYGEEARKVKNHIDQTILLQKIKHIQDNPDSTKPRLILPDSKLIHR